MKSKRYATTAQTLLVGVLALVLVSPALSGEVEEAIDSLRTIRDENYSLKSSNFGTLPGPAELAAAQVNFRKLYHVDKDWKHAFTQEKREQLEQILGYATPTYDTFFRTATGMEYHIGATGALAGNVMVWA